MDSLLKSGTIVGGDEDSLAQAEADSGSAIPGSKPGLPFVMKAPTKKEIAAFQLAVLNAVTAMQKKDYAKARRVLAPAEPTERLAQVYKSILMANVFMGQKDYVRADSVLQACLEWVGGSVWQSYLLNRRIQIFPLTEPGRFRPAPVLHQGHPGAGGGSGQDQLPVRPSQAAGVHREPRTGSKPC